MLLVMTEENVQKMNVETVQLNTEEAVQYGVEIVSQDAEQVVEKLWEMAWGTCVWKVEPISSYQRIKRFGRDVYD